MLFKLRYVNTNNPNFPIYKKFFKDKPTTNLLLVNETIVEKDIVDITDYIPYVFENDINLCQGFEITYVRNNYYSSTVNDLCLMNFNIENIHDAFKEIDVVIADI